MANRFGNSRKNSMYGGSGKDYLFGFAGNDNLVGFDGSDFIDGGAGDDVLLGGAGQDYLQGTTKGRTNEVDFYQGGGGRDCFLLGSKAKSYYRGEGFAIISDFNYREDFIAVKGNLSKYQLVKGNWLGSAAKDTAIFLGGDCIGIVQDTTNVQLSRDFLSL